MSIPVDLAALPVEAARFGPGALLVTNGTDGSGPHVASVVVTFADGTLTMNAGRRTRGNVNADSAVTLVWPAGDGGELCLIVDGSATAGARESLLVQPTSAVLHKLATGPVSPNASGNATEPPPD